MRSRTRQFLGCKRMKDLDENFWGKRKIGKRALRRVGSEQKSLTGRTRHPILHFPLILLPVLPYFYAEPNKHRQSHAYRYVYMYSTTSLFILFTLRSALPLEIADDQPSRLAEPPSMFLADRLTHVISRLSSLVYKCPFVGDGRSHLPNHIDYG